MHGATPADSPDDELTRLAMAGGAGDAGATVAFFRATQRDVYRFLTGLVRATEAEDLAQETYLRALRSLPAFAGRSSARTWLLSIARRVAADHVRGARRRPRTRAGLDPAALAGEHAPTTPSADQRVLVRELVQALDPDRREAFVLTQLLDLTYADAASVCGCPVGTIRSRVARARADLVAALADDPETALADRPGIAGDATAHAREPDTSEPDAAAR